MRTPITNGRLQCPSCRRLPRGRSSKSALAMWQYASCRCRRRSSNLDLSSTMVLSEPTTAAETTGAIETPPTLSRLRFVTLGPSSLDWSLSTSNRVLVTKAARETAHASAKKTVYGVERRATHGLLLCFSISTKNKASPAKSHTCPTPHTLSTGKWHIPHTCEVPHFQHNVRCDRHFVRQKGEQKIHRALAIPVEQVAARREHAQ